MDIWHDFHGPNAGYVLELYDRYREDPDAVDAATRALFEAWTPSVDGAAAPSTDGVHASNKARVAASTASGSSR